MEYIERDLSKIISNRMKQYPVVSVTGPRQSGKSTLLKNLYPNCKYVTLEDPDMRLFAAEDPRGFLNTYPNRVILEAVTTQTMYIKSVVIPGRSPE